MDEIPNGFISLIEYEEKYNDKLLIMFPSQKYRNGNIIYSTFDKKFQEIVSIKIDPLTGYRIPELKEIIYIKK